MFGHPALINRSLLTGRVGGRVVGTMHGGDTEEEVRDQTACDLTLAAQRCQRLLHQSGLLSFQSLTMASSVHLPPQCPSLTSLSVIISNCSPLVPGSFVFQTQFILICKISPALLLLAEFELNLFLLLSILAPMKLQTLSTWSKEAENTNPSKVSSDIPLLL